MVWQSISDSFLGFRTSEFFSFFEKSWSLSQQLILCGICQLKLEKKMNNATFGMLYR